MASTGFNSAWNDLQYTTISGEVLTNYYIVEYDVTYGCENPTAVNFDPDACYADDKSCVVECYDDDNWPK